MPSSDDDPLHGWTEASRAILRKRLLRPMPTGSIPSDEVAALVRAESADADGLLTRLLPIARSYAHPPISNFRVGAVALGASGALYLGANLEVAGSALNQAVHGEQSAVGNAFGHHEKGIAAIAVTAAPCGHCRQFLNEITDGSRIRILVDGQPVRTLEALLPASFGPQDLGLAAGMMSNMPAPLKLARDDDVAAAALDAASRSYAPHTKSPSGCAIAMKSGRIFSGSYLENAAFNPSLSPMQSALVNVQFAAEEFSTIRRVVLVEVNDAAISQRAATETVLAAIAPGVQLEVLEAKL